MTHEEILQHCIEKKAFDSAIIRRKELLIKFFDHMKEKTYSGPFRKSMFINHSTLILRAKDIGIKLGKNRRTGNYYIDNDEFKHVPKPVMFDPALIDIPKE